MVISNKYEYLFIAVPHTASTAIGRELCELYAGQTILRKHAHYHEFVRIATAAQLRYRVFVGMRNPLDVVLSVYYQQQMDQDGRFSNSHHWRCYGGTVSRRQLRRYRYIRDNRASFTDYFKKFYNRVYDSWGNPRPGEFDQIIRYENLQTEFSRVLHQLDIDQIRPLPMVNTTPGKIHDLDRHYTPEIRPQARRVLGPYMKRWGYEFPTSWSSDEIPWYSELEFHLLGWFKKQLLPVRTRLVLTSQAMGQWRRKEVSPPCADNPSTRQSQRS